MLGAESVIKGMIEEQLLSLDVAYIAKVLSYSGGVATIQPLGMIKQYGKPAEKPSILGGVPVIKSAQNKIGTKQITYVYNAHGDTKTETITTLTPLAAGDLVFCVCADRNISEARRGNMATPPAGHHSQSDSVIVGVL